MKTYKIFPSKISMRTENNISGMTEPSKSSIIIEISKTINILSSIVLSTYLSIEYGYKFLFLSKKLTL